MDDLVFFYNVSEIVIWGLVGVGCVGWSLRQPGRGRLGWGLLGLVFLGFGFSDWVEIQTGAWWRPWWLAVWKCGSGIAIGLGLWWLRPREDQGVLASSGDPETPSKDLPPRPS